MAKILANQELDELSVLQAETSKIEVMAKSTVGGKTYNYLRIIGNSASSDREFTEAEGSSYIKGAKTGCWIIPTKRINLGKEPEVTIKGAFMVYKDTIPGVNKDPKSKEKPMPQTVGYCMPSYAEQIPLTQGSFDRHYIDQEGVEHTLQAIYWMFLHLHDYPDMEDVLLTFQSKGSKFYRQIMKELTPQAQGLNELRLKLGSVIDKAEGYNASYFYPAMTVIGRNYGLSSEGKITLIKDGLPLPELTQVIKESHALNTEYRDQQLVQTRDDLVQFIASQSVPALEDKTPKKAAKQVTYEVKDAEDDDDDEPISF